MFTGHLCRGAQPHVGSRHPGAKRWNPASGAHAFNLRAANMGLMSLSRLLVLRTGNESGSQVERLILPPFSPPPRPRLQCCWGGDAPARGMVSWRGGGLSSHPPQRPGPLMGRLPPPLPGQALADYKQLPGPREGFTNTGEGWGPAGRHRARGWGVGAAGLAGLA